MNKSNLIKVILNKNKSSYKLSLKRFLELNLYGEFVGIWYPDKIYYLQIDGSPYTDDVRWRKGTWGMLGPGISATINNRYNFKFVDVVLNLPY